MYIVAYFFLLQITTILSFSHQKPLHQKLWSERCTKNSIALNDCNWCWCDVRQKFQCKARVCEEIDMFGHFKDAIREIDVGMEGHGSWRSSNTPCTPGVHYRRGGVLCLCDEYGNWPNPVCRDLFRILHTVEVHQDTVNQTCTPTKLYLVGCNVCFCSSSGYLNPELCTKTECQEGDPALPENRPKAHSSIAHVDETVEVYAKCSSDETYDLGCRTCICLRNNRLICNECSEEGPSTQKPSMRKRHKHRKKKHVIQNTRFGICEGKYANENFFMGCSECYCNKYSTLFCSLKNCITPVRSGQVNLELSDIDPPKIKDAKAPTFDELCQPGTRYKRGCNTCICITVKNNIKVIDCSLKKCSDTGTDKLQDCFVGKAYMMNCRICYCYVIKGVKHQICHANGECKKDNVNELEKGYCLPLHKYKKECNTCKCLSDGKTLACSTNPCAARTLQPLSVDLVPVQMKNSEPCPKGHSYKLNCNVCFCLSNGNAICTTRDCSDDYQDY